MGAERTIAPAGRNSLLAHADPDPARPRDGALHRVRALSRVCHASLLCTGPHADRDYGSIHPYQVTDPVAEGTIRYWHRRADCRICSGRARNAFRIDAVE